MIIKCNILIFKIMIMQWIDVIQRIHTLKEAIVFNNGLVKLICHNVKNILFRITDSMSSNDRLDIFLGITGLLIAIMIFITESMAQEKKYKINQKIIQKETRLKFNITLLVTTLIVIWMSNLIGKSEIEEKTFFIINENLYYFIQMLINILIISSFLGTVKMCYSIIALNLDKDLVNKKVNEYIRHNAKKINNKRSKEDKKIELRCHGEKNKYQNFIKKYQSNIDKTEIMKIYKEEIKSNETGIIVGVNFTEIQKILSSNSIYLNFTVGEKIDRDKVIAYSTEENLEKNRKILMYIEIEKNNIGKKEFNENCNDLIKKAFNNDKYSNYDEDNNIYNFLKYLYNNEMFDLIDYLFGILYEFRFKICSNYDFNNKFIKLLTKLSNACYNYKDFIRFEELIDWKYELYENQLIKYKKSNEITFNLYKDYFVHTISYILETKKYEYYDKALSNLLKYICKLLKMKKYKAIDIFFDNAKRVFLNSIKYNELIKIANYQFTFGIIKYITIMYENRKMEKYENKKIKDIMKEFIHMNIIIDNPEKYLHYFFYYYEKETEIQKTYLFFELEEKRKYKIMCIVAALDDVDVIKTSLYILFQKYKKIQIDKSSYPNHIKNSINNRMKEYIENMDDYIAKNFAEGAIKCEIKDANESNVQKNDKKEDNRVKE